MYGICDFVHNAVGYVQKNNHFVLELTLLYYTFQCATSEIMKSNFVLSVVLLLVISYYKVLSSKNDTSQFANKPRLRDSKDSREEADLRVLTAEYKTGASPDTIETTTFRNVRLNSSLSSTQERDIKLMNLLASRRRSLHQDRFRTHNRTSTTGRTKSSTEATSKSPIDYKTVCVRNCTKNFTRRTTASCMRQCSNIQRRSNTTSFSNSYASEKENAQKDTNEILFTDESSHGFFVVAKDVNDTMNHISEPRKKTGIFSGDVYKSRPRSKANISTTDTDLESDSYLYLGRKVSSLRPSFLSISSVSNEHPQIFEVSVSQKPPRPKSSNKFAPRDRISPPFTKKLNVGKLGSLVSPIFVTENNPEQIVKPIIKQNEIYIVKPQKEDEPFNITTHVPITTLQDITSPIEDSTESLLVEDLQQKIVIIQSTPMIINVIDEDETTVVPNQENETNPTTLEPKNYVRTDHKKIEVPSHLSEDKTNLIIFVNKSNTAVTSPPLVPNSTTDKSSMTFIKTTIFSSVRSTVYPPRQKTLNGANIAKEPQSRFPVEANVDETSSAYENVTGTMRSLVKLTGGTDNLLPKDSDLTRLSIATYILAGLGMLPILILIVYLTKSLILRGYSKHDEDFDVCITDQKPINSVKKAEIYNEVDESGQYEQCSISSMDEFNRANLRLKSLLGEGNFGKVWKAEADDLSGHLDATRIVAVKTVRSGSCQNGLREEATIMRKLGSHPNVVTLLGACIESEPQMLIMEFAMRGRLLSLLRAARSATNILPASVPGGKSLAPLSPRTLTGFSLDIATGMEYIAEKKIVHRDLAARNVLIDHNGVCKICDFGMSTDLDVVLKSRNKQYDMTTMQSSANKLDKFKFDFGERFMSNWNHGLNSHNTKKPKDTLGRRPALPIRWMAPESLQYNEFSIKSDVWAFGIVLWEIATLGATPYSNFSGREVVRHVLQGTRPELPKDGRHGFVELMTQCWHKEPSLRPNFREARSEISRYACKWLNENSSNSDYMDISGFSEDMEHGMVYFNQRISEFECEI